MTSREPLDAGKLRCAAPDLRTSFPRSPRETLAGYVLAARILDKCRASLAGMLGDYYFAASPGGNPTLDSLFFDFTGIAPEAFQAFVATGADDEAVAEWITAHAKPRPFGEIVQWNNRLRDLRPSEAPLFAQEFMEEMIAHKLPKHRPVYVWFDIYDIEEGRL